MELIDQKKLTDKLFDVIKEFGLNPSHIQTSLDQQDNSARFIVIFFGGIKFDESDAKLFDGNTDKEE